MAKFSITQLQAWNECHQKWRLKYGERIRKGYSGTGPMAMGKLVHAGLAAAMHAHYLNPGVSSYAFSEARKAIITMADTYRPEEYTQILDEYGEMILVPEPDNAAWDKLVEDSCNLTYRTLDQLELLDHYEILADANDVPYIEYPIESEMENGHFFNGVVDLVAYNTLTGMTELIDWKVKGEFSTYENFLLTQQTAMYCLAIRSQGQPIDLCINYQIKNAPPKVPTVLKNGKAMSRENITTDWHTYRAALVEAGFFPDEYEDMRYRLESQELFRKIEIYYGPSALGTIYENFLATVREIDAAEAWPMVLGYPCQRCEYAELCRSRIFGLPVEALFEDGTYIMNAIDTESDSE